MRRSAALGLLHVPCSACTLRTSQRILQLCTSRLPECGCSLQDFTKLDAHMQLDSLPAPQIQGTFGEVECCQLH